ncbi:MAG: acyl-CoA dehydrogenase [Hyphomicrobiaceae bacterium]
MTSLIDRRHLAFVLADVLKAAELFALPGFEGHDAEGAMAMIDVADRLATDKFLPSYSLVDANEPRLENGHVVLPAEIGEALAAFREGGFPAMTAMPEAGGLGLPRTYANAAFLSFQAANISIANYAMLTMSAAELLAHHGSPEQKQRYLVPMLEGRIFGTMALSEPQAGSSLGDIATTAKPRADGTYALKGTKMWISGGEHDMPDNIVHLMLARVDGAPKGVKGISLFIVPRKRLDADGRPAIWNHIGLAGLNHKMGQRGTVNTVLNIGEGGETIGEIVGAPGPGLAQMVPMLNGARIGVALGAVAHASAGYRLSLAYARDRLQGRLPDAKDPASPQVPIIAHADVRRMLLQQKSVAEGGIAMALYLAQLADLKHAAADADQRKDAGLLLDFLTPVFKAWFSEECLTANFNAIQVLGGAGYTRDHPLEQHYRDNRLNPIHEGTNGIQGLDLLGRKSVMAGGRALQLFRERVQATCDAARAVGLGRDADRLGDAMGMVVRAAAKAADVGGRSGAAAAMALAPDYMELMGGATLAWIWLEQARVAKLGRGAVADTDERAAFLEGLSVTSRFVSDTVLPRAAAAGVRMTEADAAPSYFDMMDAMFG